MCCYPDIWVTSCWLWTWFFPLELIAFMEMMHSFQMLIISHRDRGGLTHNRWIPRLTSKGAVHLFRYFLMSNCHHFLVQSAPMKNCGSAPYDSHHTCYPTGAYIARIPELPPGPPMPPEVPPGPPNASKGDTYTAKGAAGPPMLPGVPPMLPGLSLEVSPMLPVYFFPIVGQFSYIWQVTFGG